MSLSVIVLAAGQGRRMYSDLPKVLHRVAGKPLLRHVIDTARRLNPASIHVVYGHGGDQVRAEIDDADIVWCHQAEQLGTGHAVAQAMPSVDPGNRVLVLCGDVPLVRANMLEALVAVSDAAISVLTAKFADPTGYGRIVRDPAGKVTAIVEQRDASAQELEIDEINTGIMAIDAGRLEAWLSALDNDNSQGEYYLTDVVGMAFAEGLTVAGVLAENAGETLGINDMLQLADAERLMQRRQADELMSRGVTLRDPSRIDIRGELVCGTDVVIDVGAVFEGRVELGDRVTIGPNCVIRDSSIGADSSIDANCYIEQAVTGARCLIGPFARLRPGNVLADRVKVGNFVELKNSQIAEGSKVNHLTYVGDSTIASNVNIGAGTVTCNYDGANKHRTMIGEGAFIGSGVMLVAPVTIGAGATIGAGSTISKDTPQSELTIARARQVTVEGWKRPVKKPK